MKIAYDLDGVVIDTYELIRQCLLDEYGINFKKEEHKQYRFEIPGVSDLEAHRVIADYLQIHWPKAKPIPGSLWAIKQIHRITKEKPIFITARALDTFSTTNQWLTKHLGIGVPFTIHMTTFDPKHKIVESIGVDWFVEDRYKEANECAPFVKKMFLYNSPWNENRALLYNNIQRINNLNDIEKELKRELQFN